MSDYISRQATIDAIVKSLGIKGEEYLLQSERSIVEVLKHFPSADVRENAHGEWINIEPFDNSDNSENDISKWHRAKCTQCNRYSTIPYLYHFKDEHFCSFCGAKMTETVTNPDHKWSRLMKEKSSSFFFRILRKA